MAIIGPFALTIGVMNVKTQRLRGAVQAGPLQHLQVTVGIAECCNRPAADVLHDADRLALLVVDEVDIRQPVNRRYSVAHLKFELDSGSDDLLWRYAVGFVSPRPHEINATARDDECLEAVGAQVGQQLQHRLIDHLCVEPIGLRVAGALDPVVDRLVELRLRHAGMGDADNLQQPVNDCALIT